MKTIRSIGIAQALVFGLAIGFAVSSSSCGPTKPATKKCNMSTCDGCCDDTGTCYGANDAGLQSNDACGLGGKTCQMCSGNQTCIMGDCRIGGTGGGGGGGGSGGSGGASGGTGGTGGDGGTCSATECRASTGACVGYAQQNFTKCGTNGAACAGCPAGKSCTNGSCGTPSCGACLDASGNCRTDKDTLMDTSYCGHDGGVCRVCDTAHGAVCMAGLCTGGMGTACSPTNCDGCCAGNTCIGYADGGTNDAQCGRNATSCNTCNSPATCDKPSGQCMGGGTGGGGGTFPFPDGGLATCDSTTCPTGCCDFILGCLSDGMTDPLTGALTICGTGGAVCQRCVGACGGAIPICI